jgi:hypothetical protein
VPEGKQHKRRLLLLGQSENSCTRRGAEYIGHLCSYDFVMDLLIPTQISKPQSLAA